MNMHLTDKGLLEIAEHEGLVPAPYLDSVNVPTWGVGHTKAAGGIDPLNEPRGMPSNIDAVIGEVLKVFREDVAKYEARVNRAISGAPIRLKPHQFDALVSWDFNTGGATWRNKAGNPCQLIREIHAGNLSGDGFMGWLRPAEIRKRRKAEQDLFRTGDYDANGDRIPIWKVDSNMRLRGLHSTISGAEVLKRMGRAPAMAPPKPSVPAWLARLLRAA